MPLRNRFRWLLYSVSAAELIEQIKALPPAELEMVRNFLLNGSEQDAADSPLEFVARERAQALGGKVMDENEELFRKLAQ